MKAFSSALLGVSLLSTTSVGYSAELIIGAGQAVGEYTQTVVPAIDAALSEYGHSATAEVSAGSQENIDRLLSGELDAALVQMDVLLMNQGDDVGDDSPLLFVDGITPEALLCAARTDGRVRSYYNLTDEHDEALVLSIGGEDSGTAATMSYLLALDPDFDIDQVAFVYEANTEAELDRLLAGNRDLVCFVMMANPENSLIKAVNENDELVFIDFVSAYALEAEIGGSKVYETMVVPVSKGLWGFRAKKVQTLSTWMGLVVSRELDAEMIGALQTALANPELLPPTSSAGKAKRMWGDFKSKAGEYSSKAKEKAITLKEKAAEKAVILKDKAKDLAGKTAEKASELKEKTMEKLKSTTD